MHGRTLTLASVQNRHRRIRTRTGLMTVRPNRSLALMGVLSLASALAGCAGYSSSSYHGDGTMYVAPSGPWRFEVEFPEIDLTKSGSYQYEAIGLPRDAMLAMITLDHASDEQLDELDKARTRVSLKVTNQDTGETSVKGGALLGDWGRTDESWSGRVIEFQGVWFKIARHDRFTIELVVTATPVPGIEPVMATPRIRGGGFGNAREFGG